MPDARSRRSPAGGAGGPAQALPQQGDRLRRRHTVDEGVFSRSLATRGQLGGLSRSAGDQVAVLDAMGKDVILVETAGVGQDEVAARIAARQADPDQLAEEMAARLRAGAGERA
jgi:hypothetical protein